VRQALRGEVSLRTRYVGTRSDRRTRPTPVDAMCVKAPGLPDC
jgi:hypothetical protein